LTPFDDSLISQHFLTRFGCAGLVFLGGLGVYVIYDLLQLIKHRRHSLQLHSKIVLTTSVMLVFSSALLLYFFSRFSESESISAGNALFLSVSSRTAGFTTVEIASLPSVSLAMIIVLMMIGGSPGSTAGGIKTTTVAVAATAIISTLRGNRHTLLGNRVIPTVIVLRSFTIIVLFSLFTVSGVLLLQLISSANEITNNVFETVSAICTVGMSIGDTTVNQSDAGRLLLSAFMFLGRIGPFSFLLFLLSRERPSMLSYPEESVIIG
jgi:trk system potassium uptake protein TrkH